MLKLVGQVGQGDAPAETVREREETANTETTQSGRLEKSNRRRIAWYLGYIHISPNVL